MKIHPSTEERLPFRTNRRNAVGAWMDQDTVQTSGYRVFRPAVSLGRGLLGSRALRLTCFESMLFALR